MAVDWISANTASSRSGCAASHVCGSRASSQAPTHNDVCHCGEVLSPDSRAANGSFTSIQYPPEGVSHWRCSLVWFIQEVIKHHQDSLRPLNVVFVDVKKAFDSFSHQSILVAASRLGVPPPFFRYIHELYNNVVATLRIGPERSNPTKFGRDVRQGDPLSIHLYNGVIGMCLAGLDPRLGG